MAKRPRTSGRANPPGSSFFHQISSWGSKRPRTHRVTGNYLRPCSADQIPFPVPKQACRALHDPTLPRSPFRSGSEWCRRDWSSVGDGPAWLISQFALANDVADYICFRAVCRPWRQWSTDPRAHGPLDPRFHPRGWIMLREKLAVPGHRRRFLSASTGRCIQMDLPELDGHSVFGPTTEGLLVLLDPTTFVVRLLNPLTRQLTDLPPATTLLSPSKLSVTCAADLLKALTVGLADDCTTVVVHFWYARMLVVAKPGDERWTLVDHGTFFASLSSFAGRFYCVTESAIMEVRTRRNQKKPQLVTVAKLTMEYSRMADNLHLVDNGGELILVHRALVRSASNGGRDVCRCYRSKYLVYRIDARVRKTIRVRGLGGRAAFVGMNRAVSVPSDVFPTISADTIYPGFDCDVKTCLEQIDAYHLRDESIEPSNIKTYKSLALPYRIADCLSLCVASVYRPSREVI